MSESQVFATVAGDQIQQYIQSEKKSTVYVEKSNNHSQLENILHSNDKKLPLSALNFGATNNVTFSNGAGLLKELILEIKVPNATELIEDFAAYNAIKNIKYSIGGCEYINMTKQDIFFTAMNLCRNKDQKERLLDVSGRRRISVAGSGVETKIALANNTDSIGGYSGDVNKDKTYYAILPMPWTNLGNCKNKLKPFPLHLIYSPNAIELQITWEDKDVFAAGAITGFSSALLYYKRGQLMSNDQAKSLAVPYKYPCITSIGSEYSLVAGQTELNIRSFRRGEIQDLLFCFVPVGTTGYPDAGVTNKRLLSGARVENLKLLFNSQVVWEANNRLTEVYRLIDDPEDPENCYREDDYFIKSTTANQEVNGVIDGHTLKVKGQICQTATNIEVVPRGKYMYNIPIAEIVSKLQGHEGFTGGDFSSQSLTLQFSAIRARGANYTYANVACRVFQINNYRTYYKFEKGVVSLNW